METVVNLQYLQEKFSGKKIFVTGHTGFKGSWLLAILSTLGANVKGYALEPEYENGLYQLLESSKICESIIADIRDKELLEEEIISFQPDFIFHLAAQPLVRRSYGIPSETFEINVVGTANLLEVLIKLQKPCTTVIITTDKVYENKEADIHYRETDILGGYDPYSASKACTEIVVSSFRNSFFNSNKIAEHHKGLASARAGNVIGGGDWNMDRLLPDIVRFLQSGNTIEVRNPNAVRPWQHVLEPLVGYLQLAISLAKDPKNFSSAYNFGPAPGDHLTVKELVELSIQSWGNGKWKDISNSKELHEAGLLKLDINKAGKVLNWRPKLNAAEAVEWTIEWYKKPKKEQVSFSIDQIKNYLSL